MVSESASLTCEVVDGDEAQPEAADLGGILQFAALLGALDVGPVIRLEDRVVVGVQGRALAVREGSRPQALRSVGRIVVQENHPPSPGIVGVL